MLSFAKQIDVLAKIFESESNCAFDCFDENKMIRNPAKFHAIMLENRESDLASRNKRNRKPEYSSRLRSSYKVLGVHIDHRLDFNLRRQDFLVCTYPTECA